jgi:PIN domain nuclease of toxin-antitoxin system
MQIKLHLGKLSLSLPLAGLVANQRERNGLRLLDVRLEHVYALDGLPAHHKDPFDRLLVAQALAEQIPIVGADSALDAYGVNRLW